MFGKTATRTIALATTLAITALALPADAFAGERGRRHHGAYGHNHGPVVVYKKKRRHRNDAGVAVAAGIIGLTVGALIAGSANNRYYAPQPTYRYRQPAYHPPRRVYRQPRHVSYRPEPFTAPWYRYCAAKFRSFDAASGTYMTYSGVRKLCR